MQKESRSDFWSLSSSQLAAECRLIANGGSSQADKALQAEAKRLYAGWRETIGRPGEDFGDLSGKAVQLAGLRKRTIEILIKLGRQ